MVCNFADFISLTEYVEKAGAVMVPEHWTKEIAAMMPKISLNLPTVNKTSRIDHIMDKKNPIFVGLSDGTKLFFTHDEFRRIHGKPEKGKDLIVTMQRLPDDYSDLPSVITKCMVKN
jgi:hypothetical protein